MFLCKWRARKQISLHGDNKVVLYCISPLPSAFFSIQKVTVVVGERERQTRHCGIMWRVPPRCIMGINTTSSLGSRLHGSAFVPFGLMSSNAKEHIGDNLWMTLSWMLKEPKIGSVSVQINSGWTKLRRRRRIIYSVPKLYSIDRIAPSSRQ